MRPAILVLGVFGTVVGIFLFVIGYHMMAIPSAYMVIDLYQDQYYRGLTLEISGGITTAMGLAIAVFGAVSKKKEPRNREASDRSIGLE